VRDHDIRRAIHDALLSTGQFNDCWMTGLPEDSGTGAYEQSAAAIDPGAGNAAQYGDAAPDGAILIQGISIVTLLYRNHDVELRDSGAERLLNVACNALNGNGLGGLIFPQTALVRDWRWVPPTQPERRIEARYFYQYFVEGWAQFDTTE
jgi:hypothetical protein